MSLRDRVVGAVPEPTKLGIAALVVEARELSRRLPKCERMSRETFVSKYTGRKRTRYQNACDSLDANPIDIARDSTLSAFVKAEKYNPIAKVNPAPRMIQARNARFNVELGTFLRPIEHHIYRLRDKSGMPCIAKGMNPRDRAYWLKEKIDRFSRPLVYSLDMKRFDQHVSLELLEIEASVYKASNPDPEFAALLHAQFHNRGYTQNGHKYKTRGKRASGDMQTACGNCLIATLMCRAMAKMLKIDDYEVLCDGDDCLFITDERFEESLKTGYEWAFLQFGHEAKLENRATSLEDVEWCQAKPIWFPGGDRFVAHWPKILSSGAAGTRYWKDTTSIRDMAFSVGQCLLALYPGTPIIQAYAEALCRSGGKLNADIYMMDVMYKVNATGLKIGKLQSEPIHPFTRDSFAKAFGVDFLEQVRIEQMLENWNIGTGVKTVPMELLKASSWEWSYHVRDQPHWEIPV